MATCQGGQGGYRAGLSEHICPLTLFSFGVRAPIPSQLPLALDILWGVQSILPGNRLPLAV